MPATVGAVLIFLVLAVPGASFELLRQRRRSSWDQTALEEVARILMVSVGLDLVGFGILRLLSLFWPSSFVNLETAARIGLSKYSGEHLWALALSFAVILLGAELFGLLILRSLNQEKKGLAGRAIQVFEWLLRYQPGMQMQRADVWQTLFRGTRPPKSNTKVTILTTSRDMWFGNLASYTVEGSDVRDIAIAHPMEVMRFGEEKETVPQSWKFVVIPSTEIREIYVTYEKSGEK